MRPYGGWRARGRASTGRPYERSRGRCAALALAVVAVAALLAGCATPGTIAGTGHLPAAPAQAAPAPLPPIRFPQDEAPHRDLTEWWYYTGHLQGTDPAGAPHRYGFELVVFQTLRGAYPPYYAAHYAVSDVTRGQFHYDEATALGDPTAIPPAGSTGGFDLSVGDWHMRGLGGHDRLQAAMTDYAIDLALTGLKPAVLHGSDGLITYGDAGFSYYYSRPLMGVSGTIQDHGVTIPVSGTAWMDHQWGNFISLAGAGWDWYSIQLDDDTEYMLYVIRDAQKRPLSTVGTYVAADGSATALPAAAIQTRATGSWTSPVTGGVYPSGWQVEVATQGLALALTPELLDQELVTAHSTGIAYWEGAVSIDGTRDGRPLTGQGYVELTGYASIPAGEQGGTPFP